LECHRRGIATTAAAKSGDRTKRLDLPQVEVPRTRETALANERHYQVAIQTGVRIKRKTIKNSMKEQHNLERPWLAK